MIASQAPNRHRQAFLPPPVTKIEDTGLSPLWLQDLILKTFYFRGYLTGYEVAEAIALPFTAGINRMLEILKREKLIEVKASGIGLGEG